MIRWIDGTQLQARWKVAPHSILEAVRGGLKVYRSIKGELVEVELGQYEEAFKNHDRPPIRENFQKFFIVSFFNLDELEEFERVNGGNDVDLNASERRHYGLLKAERDTFDRAIEASVKAASYCEKHAPILKDEFLNFIDKNHEGLPKTTVDKIWGCIPRSHKKGPGRPQKTAKK